MKVICWISGIVCPILGGAEDCMYCKEFTNGKAFQDEPKEVKKTVQKDREHGSQKELVQSRKRRVSALKPDVIDWNLDTDLF